MGLIPQPGGNGIGDETHVQPHTWTRICDADRRRLALVVGTESTSGVDPHLRAWPVTNDRGIGIAPAAGQTHVLVHRSSHGDVVTREWYLYHTAQGTLAVQVIDIPIPNLG